MKRIHTTLDLFQYPPDTVTTYLQKYSVPADFDQFMSTESGIRKCLKHIKLLVRNECMQSRILSAFCRFLADTEFQEHSSDLIQAVLHVMQDNKIYNKHNLCQDFTFAIQHCNTSTRQQLITAFPLIFTDSNSTLEVILADSALIPDLISFVDNRQAIYEQILPNAPSQYLPPVIRHLFQTCESTNAKPTIAALKNTVTIEEDGDFAFFVASILDDALHTNSDLAHEWSHQLGDTLLDKWAYISLYSFTKIHPPQNLSAAVRGFSQALAPKFHAIIDIANRQRDMDLLGTVYQTSASPIDRQDALAGLLLGVTLHFESALFVLNYLNIESTPLMTGCLLALDNDFFKQFTRICTRCVRMEELEIIVTKLSTSTKPADAARGAAGAAVLVVVDQAFYQHLWPQLPPSVEADLYRQIEPDVACAPYLLDRLECLLSSIERHSWDLTGPSGFVMASALPLYFACASLAGHAIDEGRFLSKKFRISASTKAMGVQWLAALVNQFPYPYLVRMLISLRDQCPNVQLPQSSLAFFQIDISDPLVMEYYVHEWAQIMNIDWVDQRVQNEILPRLNELSQKNAVTVVESLHPRAVTDERPAVLAALYRGTQQLDQLKQLLPRLHHSDLRKSVATLLDAGELLLHEAIDPDVDVAGLKAVKLVKLDAERASELDIRKAMNRILRSLFVFLGFAVRSRSESAKVRVQKRLVKEGARLLGEMRGLIDVLVEGNSIDGARVREIVTASSRICEFMHCAMTHWRDSISDAVPPASRAISAWNCSIRNAFRPQCTIKLLA